MSLDVILVSVIALVTLAGTVITLIWNIIDRRRTAFDNRMSQATELLTGHTQRRSAGIAIIEGSKNKLKRSRPWGTAIVGLFCTQAVYLLKWSGEGGRPDEILNLKRIIEFLFEFKDRPPDQAEIDDVRRRINDDIDSTQSRSQGLDRDKIKDMIARLPSNINKWVNQTPDQIAHPNEDLVREGFAAFGRGDSGALVHQFFAEDIRYHFPGRSPLAGDYEGADQVREFFLRIFELSGGTVRVELHDVVASDEHATALFTARADRAGRHLQDNQVQTFHIRDGKVTETWVHATDLYAVDEFWS